MAKQKKRAARKHAKERALKAEARGLPRAKEAPLPAKMKPQLKDASGALRYAAHDSASFGAGGTTNDAFPRGSKGGMPTLAKVGLGVVLTLAVVFALSQLRKSGDQVQEPASSQAESQEK